MTAGFENHDFAVAILAFWIPWILLHILLRKCYIHLYIFASICYALGGIFTFSIGTATGYFSVLIIQSIYALVMLYAMAQSFKKSTKNTRIINTKASKFPNFSGEADKASEVIKGQLFDHRSKRLTITEKVKSQDFIECRFWGISFKNCEWIQCKFKRTSFAHGVTFRDCKFLNCKFETPHTWLSGVFKNCRFENCKFNSTSIGEAVFEDCVFSGVLSEMIFYGKKAPKNLQVILKNVDFTDAHFLGTDFRMKVDLRSVKLPVQEEDGLFVEGKKYLG